MFFKKATWSFLYREFSYKKNLYICHTVSNERIFTAWYEKKKKRRRRNNDGGDSTPSK